MILYISYIDDPKFHAGVWKKMNGQLKALKKSFLNGALTFFYNQVGYLWDGEKVIDSRVVLHRKDYLEILKTWILALRVKKVYIRYFLSDLFFLELLRFLKDNSIRTVLEIATFPYDKEFRFGARKYEDDLYRNCIVKYVDRIVTYSNDQEIWGIKCINLSNGFDVSDVIATNRKRNIQSLNLLAVSLMFSWHGYERLIEGIHDYYLQGATRKVLVSFVGTGVQEGYYKSLTEQYQLKPYIRFYGTQKGKLLEEIYRESDVGIGSLGFYKQHDNVGSTLKIGEYCAHGLPSVCGYHDTRFPDNTPFILQVPNDPSPLNIQSIIDFYDSLTQDKDFSKKIRKYAEDHLSWEQIMRPVIEFLNDEG